jgi:hypothetical protein
VALADISLEIYLSQPRLRKYHMGTMALATMSPTV